MIGSSVRRGLTQTASGHDNQTAHRKSVGILGYLIVGYVFFLPVQFNSNIGFRIAPSDVFLLAFVLLSLPQLRVIPRAWTPSLWALPLCILLDVSRASVYYRPVPTRAEDLELMALMDRQYLKTPFYGSRKMKAWLLQQGYLVSRKRVRRLMRLMGLEAIYRRPNTSKPAPGHRIFPYLLKGVEVNRVDQVWAADITYIPMAKGFLYLAAIMDWHSRHVLAWKLSNTMDTSFCVAALEEALGKGRPEIFNTDQGSQFTSEAFTQTLQEQRVQVSMDGKGRYLDNIFAERLWRSIKYEEVYLKAYQTVAEARTGINAYLEFYNRQRPHQALGYRTPAEVYQHGQEERGAAAEEAGLPSGLVKPSAGVGDSLNLALVLS